MKSNYTIGATLDQFMVPLVFESKPSQAMINEQFEPGGAVYWDLQKYGFLNSDGTLKVNLNIVGEDRFVGPTKSGHYIVLVKCMTEMYTIN